MRSSFFSAFETGKLAQTCGASRFIIRGQTGTYNPGLTGEEDAMKTAADEVIDLMLACGGAAYFGEPVSQLEHALQAAWFATQDGSSREMVVAALLHDIGHLLHDLPETAAWSRSTWRGSRRLRSSVSSCRAGHSATTRKGGLNRRPFTEKR